MKAVGPFARDKQTKIDLLLTNVGDLNFTSSGDLQMSYGLENAVQAIKLMLETERGAIARHREYGLVNVVGLKSNNVAQAKEAITRSIVSQVGNDPRFERVEQIIVQYVNDETIQNGFLVHLQVRLSGSVTVVPITFSVNSQ